jgi:hypothetical protein
MNQNALLYGSVRYIDDKGSACILYGTALIVVKITGRQKTRRMLCVGKIFCKSTHCFKSIQEPSILRIRSKLSAFGGVAWKIDKRVQNCHDLMKEREERKAMSS